MSLFYIPDKPLLESMREEVASRNLKVGDLCTGYRPGVFKILSIGKLGDNCSTRPVMLQQILTSKFNTSGILKSPLLSDLWHCRKFNRASLIVLEAEQAQQRLNIINAITDAETAQALKEQGNSK